MKANFLLYEKYQIFFYYGVASQNDMKFIEDVIKFFNRYSPNIQTFPSLENFILFYKIMKLYNTQPTNQEIKKYKK